VQHLRDQRLQEIDAAVKLTDAEKAGINAIWDQHEKQVFAVLQNPSLDRAAAREQVHAIMQSSRDQVRAVLTPAQQAAFDAMPRRPHPGGWRDAERRAKERLAAIDATVRLTPAERSAIKAIWFAKRAQIHAALADPSLDRPEIRERIRTLRESTRSDVRSVLTPEQQKLFDAMPRPPRPQPSNS
jgi:Spy/CpxP family protein refolding chaperone